MEKHHNPSDYSSYTANRLPVELIWHQSFPQKWQALKVERQLKGWSRKKKIAMMNENWDLLRSLSKSSEH
jgi:predicted GIY-YIG superfamily endonuclease